MVAQASVGFIAQFVSDLEPGHGANTRRNDRKSLFKHSSEKVRNYCCERPPSCPPRGPPAKTGAAIRASLVLLSRQYPITNCYVNLKLVFGQSWTLAPAGARGFYVNWL